MKSVAATCLLMLGSSALLFAADSVPTTQPMTAPASQPAAINKFCAVEQDNEIDPKVTIQHDGKTIGFCCEDCIPKFQKDPAKYLKDLK